MFAWCSLATNFVSFNSITSTKRRFLKVFPREKEHCATVCGDDDAAGEGVDKQIREKELMKSSLYDVFGVINLGYFMDYDDVRVQVVCRWKL